ncbi:MAG: phosphate ABC transporter permease PstA [Actinobacteria bacterium]|nr:phosphate ABC transporter permease PstA [Actinomycetota bacterium]
MNATIGQRSVRRRRAADLAVRATAWIGASIGIGAMLWILAEVARRGAKVWSWSFFTQMPAPVGEPGGGVLNAIYGTIVMTLIAAAAGIPLGFFAGIYLAEFGRNGRLAGVVRIIGNVMVGIPSILVGVFVFSVFVRPMGHFSGLAGALALAIIMLPVMARTSEDILNLVPNELRESALAMGAPRWRVTLGVVVRAARSGLITGALLAVVRVSGETAPLLLTALNNQFWSWDVTQPTANLTVGIYSYAMSPYPDWVDKAWGASLLIIVGVLGATLLARLILQRGKEW